MLINYHSYSIGIWMNIKDVIHNALLIGLSGALLWLFSNIWRYGPHIIQEPNKVILILETAVLLFIFIYGISRYISGLKREIERREKTKEIIKMPNMKATAGAASVSRSNVDEQKQLSYKDN